MEDSMAWQYELNYLASARETSSLLYYHKLFLCVLNEARTGENNDDKDNNNDNNR